MTPKLQRFVAEYVIDLNATQAAIRAGYSARTAEQQGSRLLRNAKVAASVSAALEQRQKRTEVTADRVLTEAWALLTADPRELVELHVDSCRHCYGTGHRYQRTAAELERDRAAHALAQPGRGKPGKFDAQGGTGFDPRKPPVAACPECFGRGVPRVQLNDTRRLSPAAASLYAGVKQTRDGVEVKLHSKVEAIEKLARHLGLYGDRIQAPAAVLEQISAASSLHDKGRVLLDAAARGEITAAQAANLLAGLGQLVKLGESEALERRVAELEARLSSRT